MKKTLIWIFIAVLSGLLLGNFTFSRYESLNSQNVMKQEDNKIYMIRYKTYDDIENMIDDMTNLERYVYIKNDNIYITYIGITKTKENAKKIVDLYKEKDLKIETHDIYNDEFLQNLTEYEKLLNESIDEKSILIIQNQILSCYEKLVVNNE